MQFFAEYGVGGQKTQRAAMVVAARCVYHHGTLRWQTQRTMSL